MKEKIKILLRKAWLFLKTNMGLLWDGFKSTKVFAFLKKWGLQLVNLFFLMVAYAGLPYDSVAGALVGFWLFILLAYYLFWKLFKAESLFKKDED